MRRVVAATFSSNGVYRVARKNKSFTCVVLGTSTRGALVRSSEWSRARSRV